MNVLPIQRDLPFGKPQPLARLGTEQLKNGSEMSGARNENDSVADSRIV